MTYDEFKTSLRPFKAVLILDDIVSHRKRIFWRDIFGGATLLLIVLIVVVNLNLFPFLSILSPFLLKFRGFLLIFLSLDLIFFMLECFFYSFYERSLEENISFSLARLLFVGSSEDLTFSFFSSYLGWQVADRLGISPEAMNNFLGARKQTLSLNQLSLSFTSGQRHDVSTFLQVLFENDSDLSSFFFSFGIQKEEVVATASWAEEDLEESILAKRWWRRDTLGRIPGLAKNWSYGQTFVLEHYGYDVTEEMSSRKASGRLIFMKDEMRKLEDILCRSQEANAFIVGDDDDQRLAIVESLAKAIHDGSVLPPLEHKRVFLIDGVSIIEKNPDKASFETEMSRIFAQSVETGNIIFAINHFPAFLLSARAINSDVFSSIDSYVRSSDLQIIGLCDESNFHQYIENNKEVMAHFEVVQMGIKDSTHLIGMLKEEAEMLESSTGVFFTYQSIEAVVESAERYFAGASTADKARDLLLELPAHNVKKGKRIIERSDVLELIEAKTGIPSGEVGELEKTKLLGLEDILHKRIISQDEAIKAISKAVRRSRSDLRNQHKPIGSFLFLGPTGVGKTETSKALGDIFFGPTSPMVRLDMSEFNGADGVEKLIGSFKDSKAGILASALREHQYGVLLLDEFEKAHSDVLNLFLQILDEGAFSDMKGVKVSARNMIIIATSNAGSDLIFEMVSKKRDLAESHDEIIQAIISRNIFKPELINRFDASIIFHPLDNNDLKNVANIMLTQFAKSLFLKGLQLEINDDTINFLISKGTDPTFGARPLQRALASEIESLVADEMIKGNLKKGSKFELVSDGLPDGHLCVKMKQ